MTFQTFVNSRIFRLVLMDTVAVFSCGFSIWAFHALLSSIPFPTDFRRLVLRATAGSLLSCIIVASRRFWSFFDIKNHSAVLLEGIFILNVAPLFFCIGWLTASWGATVPRDSLTAMSVAIVIGLGLVLLGHWIFERSLSSYMRSDRFKSKFGQGAV